ncbi:ribosomal protein L2 [Tanacetum coccineum]
MKMESRIEYDVHWSLCEMINKTFITTSATQTVSKEKPLRQFVAGKGKSAGRNSKVRWEGEGETKDVDPAEKYYVEDTFPPFVGTSYRTGMKGQFSFSSIPGMIESRKAVSNRPKTRHVVVCLSNGVSPYASKAKDEETRTTNVRDVFLSAFKASDAWADGLHCCFYTELGVPRMALAGSRPNFFVPRYKDAIRDSQSMAPNESVRQQDIGLNFVGVVGEKDPRMKAREKAREKQLLNGKFTADRGTITNIFATNQIKERPLKQFIAGKSKSAGRNSKGRITIFHRGGGAKRSQRTINLKRNTSSVGIVERYEYDPNRTSRIAVVRWEEKGNVYRKNNFDFAERTLPPRMLTSPTMPMKGQFNFSSLPGMTESRKVVSSGPKTGHVVVGLPNGVSPYSSKATNEGTKPTNVRDVFLSAFSSSDPWAHRGRFAFVSELGVPRMALAGSSPDFFVPRYKDVVLDTERLAS